MTSEATKYINQDHLNKDEIKARIHHIDTVYMPIKCNIAQEGCSMQFSNTSKNEDKCVKTRQAYSKYFRIISHSF